MYNKLTVMSVCLTGILLNMGMAFAVTKPPGPLDSETGLAGVVMAGATSYLVWRRRKARKD